MVGNTNTRRSMRVVAEQHRLKQPFVISRGSISAIEALVVELEQDGVIGRGEAEPQAFLGQSMQSERERLETVRSEIESGMSRSALQEALPRSSARNALDCALWDLAAKLSGKSVWHLLTLPEPEGPLAGDVTVCLGTPAWMQAEAARYSEFNLLKIKLDRHQVLERMEAVKLGAPNSRFIVDVNEDWSLEELKRYAPPLAEMGVVLLEQPLPRGADAGLIDYNAPLPLGADESCYDRSDLEYLKGRYAYINIKLDKTGGLTEALALAKAAASDGFGLMVGCMVGTSLAMAPGFVIASLCEFRDLDGGSMLAEDRQPALRLEQGWIYPYSRELWG